VAVTLDPLLQSILDAPVGQVQNKLRTALGYKIKFRIVEQGQLSGSKILRKIVLAAKSMPLIEATVEFDSKKIPPKILSELLRKKEGIGTILFDNKIKASRRIIGIENANDGKKIIRKYQIISENSVWFDIVEEIRLDYINSVKNSC